MIKRISFLSIVTMGAMLPMLCPARTISGVVMDKKESQPLIGATINYAPKQNAVTNIDGRFTIDDPTSSVQSITVTYMGFATQTVSVAPGNGDVTLSYIIMEEDDKKLENVIVAGTNPKEGVSCTNAQAAYKWNPDNVAEFQYTENTEGLADPSGQVLTENYKFLCIPSGCKKGYELKNEKTKNAKCVALTTCSASDASAAEHATGFKWIDVGGERFCVPSRCATGYNLTDGDTAAAVCTPINCDSARYKLVGNKCEDQVGKDCTPSQTVDRAKTWQYAWDDATKQLVCKINKCEKHYVPADDGKSCEMSEGDCTAEQLKAIPHATAGEVKKKICHPTECEYGWKPDGTKCVATAVLSADDAKKQVDDLQANYDKMKEKENSLTARLTGAAAIAGTGLGLSDILSATSEQKADDAAEADMKAYLATFRCDYGQGKNIQGGDVGIELPGGNDLFDLYVEYAGLAESVKMRKNSLGLRAGIESEVVWDKAETGLYDNAGVGKTTGSFASVARALMDPNGQDAADWAAQKSDAAAKLKRGAIEAGIGTLVGIGGNIATEAMYGSNKSDKIRTHYQGLLQIFQDSQDDADNIPVPQKTCPAGLTGTYPNCKCANPTKEYFSTAEDACITCPGDKIVDTQMGCKCPADKPVEGENNTCSAPAQGCQRKGRITPDCKCIANADESKTPGVCNCKDGYVPEESEAGNIICAAKKKDPVPFNIIINQEISQLNLSSDALFDTGKSDVKPAAEQTLKTFAEKLKGWKEQYNQDMGNWCVKIVGHTDRQKFRTNSKQRNIQLSKDRAKSVGDKLKSFYTEMQISTDGVGERDCTPGDYVYNASACRKVVVTLEEGACK